MKTTRKRLWSFVCIFALTASLFAGCGGNTDDSSDSFTSNYSSEIVSGDTLSNDNVSSSDENNEQTGNQSSSQTQNQSSTQSNTQSNSNNLKGTTVVFATWKDPDANEDGVVVDKFEKKYDINVKIDNIPQAGYINTVASRIASGNAPDVVFDNGFFPASLSVLQPIDAAKIDLSDAIWDKDFINQATINGKKYLVNTISNIWSEVGCVYYNKKLLKDNNITTPEEYYEAGKWTWDAFEKVAKEVKEKCGSDYIGAIFKSTLMLGSLGTGLYKYENGKIISGLSDSIMQDASRKMATWYKNSYIGKGSQETFNKGKVGMYVTDAFGLKKTGYFSKFNSNNLGFTYIPDYNSSQKAYSTGVFRGWGIAKGAKNPEGAGLFLKYYLDVNNYDTSSAFINSAAETFFFKLTGVSSASKRYEMQYNVNTLVGNDLFFYDYYYMVDPNQITSTLNQLENVVNSNINKVNDFISKNTK